MPEPTAPEALVEEVRARYASAARDAAQGAASCCGPSACDDLRTGGFGPGLYDPDELAALPQAAAGASLGCGTPTAVAELRPGEVVLDLGSGGGVDVLLSARRVGPSGWAYGVDMTEEMLDLARRNAADADVSNVSFLAGRIEAVPLPDDSVDVVISNCVVNLSVDKAAVLAEMRRVLRPGGRLGLTDVVAEDRLSADDRAERGSHAGCLAGALSQRELRAGLAAEGFVDVRLTATHAVADGLASTIIEARLPA
ncbi:MAG: arsenite methyltransferase [Actinomycetota bacterium]